MQLTYVAGQTPIDADEAAGLKPKHIVTQAQLNEWEQLNIVAGQAWGFRVLARRRLLDARFVRDLHRRMFDNTWRWAGTFRTSDKSLGVPWEQVSMRLTQLLANVQWQVDNAAFEPHELAARFHRDLVWIHPFPNGNGRHARLLADLLVTQLGGKRFTWGANADLVGVGETRTRYIAALKAADQGDHAPLLEFARS